MTDLPIEDDEPDIFDMTVSGRESRRGNTERPDLNASASSDLIRQSDELDAKLGDVALGGEVVRRLIRRVRIVIAVMGVALLIVAGVAVNGYKTAHEVSRQSTSAYHLCLKTNQSRANTISLWHYVMNQPGIGVTPEAKTHVLNRVDRIYAPRDCVQ